MISPFLEHGIGINRRRFELGIRWCHRIGVELKTVSVFVASIAVTILHFDYDLTVSQAWLRHQLTQISTRNTVMLSDWRRIENSSRNPIF
jgi:hypothetical protein